MCADELFVRETAAVEYMALLEANPILGGKTLQRVTGIFILLEIIPLTSTAIICLCEAK